MEPESSQPFKGDTPVQDPTPATPTTEIHSRKRVYESDLTVMEADLVRMSEVLEEKTASVHELWLHLKDIEEQVKQQAVEIDVKEKSVMEKFEELELRENYVEDMELKLSLESSVMRLAFEKEKKELVEEFEEKETKIEKTKERAEAVKEYVREISEKEEELRLMAIEIAKKEEMFKENVKQIELKKKNLKAIKRKVKSLGKTNKEKEAELKKKEENFEAREKEKAEEFEVTRRFLDVREKELKEKERELSLMKKQRVLGGEQSMQGETSKRSRVKYLVERSREVSSFVRPMERHKSLFIREPEHDGVEEESVCAVPLASVQRGEEEAAAAHERHVERQVVSLDDSEEEEEEEPEEVTCPASEFKDFNKTMAHFKEGQVWALYDSLDCMPRFYVRIMKIFKSKSCLEIKWVNPREEEEAYAGPVACGRFKLGTRETKGLLMFSHEMYREVQGPHLIKIYPRKGETWSLFRNWSNNPEQHKPPHQYDLVEILQNFDEDQGVSVVYLEKVEGFVSIFKRSERNGFMIPPREMRRFSHKVPSFKMRGNEKEGVPSGSFELDPGAVHISVLQPDPSTLEIPAAETQGGSRNNDPIIILD